ncbi:MAG: hypothetical protein K9H84_00805 [Bacteroidales bacterium]|nr:hypothetical protein [Bacteroidales bacterium]
MFRDIFVYLLSLIISAFLTFVTFFFALKYEGFYYSSIFISSALHFTLFSYLFMYYPIPGRVLAVSSAIIMAFFPVEQLLTAFNWRAMLILIGLVIIIELHVIQLYRKGPVKINYPLRLILALIPVFTFIICVYTMYT